MEENKKHRSQLDQAVGELGLEKAARVLTNYVRRMKQNQKVREFVREAKAAGKV